MKTGNKLANIALTIMLTGTVGSAQAGIINTDANGTVTDTVSGYNGWLNEDVFFGGIDFLVFETFVDSLFSIEVASDVDFGISIYEGLIANEAPPLFDNDNDFFDFSSTLTYIAGTPVFSALGSSLSNVALSNPGYYTVAVGGDDFFGPSGSVAYTASLSSLAVETVPVPSIPALLAMGLVALRLSTRRRGNNPR